jgi:tRNA A-37 threonylcarbamoyl transferase component Bud32
MSFELRPDTAVDWLVSNGLVSSPAEFESEWLGSGICNRVVKAAAPSRCFVLKQPLEAFDLEVDHSADRDRICLEKAAIAAFADALAGELARTVEAPEVVHFSERDHVLVLACIPTDRTLRDRLRDGEVTPEIGELAASILVQIHGIGTERRHRDRFRVARNVRYDRLRLGLIHETVARHHPELGETVRAAVSKLLSTEQVLVHGDYAVKNLLVERRPLTVWPIDFEFAHLGAPAFDVSYFLHELLLRAVGFPERADDYLRIADSFWRAYRRNSAWEVDHAVARNVAITMLARLAGVSAFDWLDPTDRETGRRTAVRILEADPVSARSAVRIVREEVGAEYPR